MIKYVKLLCGLKWYKWAGFNSIDFTGCRTRAEFQIRARAEEQQSETPGMSWQLHPVWGSGLSLLP